MVTMVRWSRLNLLVAVGVLIVVELEHCFEGQERGHDMEVERFHLMEQN